MQPITATSPLKWISPGLGRMALALSLGLAAGFPIAAQAQYYGRGWGPYYGGPYGGPYYGNPYYGPEPAPYSGPSPYDADDEGPEAGPPPGTSADREPGYQNASPKQTASVPLELIKQRIREAGLKLIAPPRHKGNIYLAEVEDAKSVRRRLVYDAHDGHLLENTALGPVKKLRPPPRGTEAKPDQSGKAGMPQEREPVEQAKAANGPPIEPAPDHAPPAAASETRRSE